MQELNVHEAKTKLSSLLMEVEQKGASFLICRNGKPIAELIPHKKRSRLDYHPVLSKIAIDYDPVEELSRDEWGEVD